LFLAAAWLLFGEEGRKQKGVCVCVCVCGDAEGGENEEGASGGKKAKGGEGFSEKMNNE